MTAIKGRIKRILAWLPAKAYEVGVRLRVAAYETGYIEPRSLGATVISIGNLTLGGTGKTPLVEYIAGYLIEQGHAVAILTRGYGRRASGRLTLNSPEAERRAQHGDPDDYLEAGDEPEMLARNLPDVAVVIDSDRYQGGLYAEQLGAEVLLLDDAFQHLRLGRDLDILVLDATDPFGGFEMVPFGRLREPLYGLKRADVIVVSRAHRAFDQAQVQAIVRTFCGEEVPVLYLASSIRRLKHLSTGVVYDSQHFKSWRCAIMCGIGNPTAFSDDVAELGMSVVAEEFFRDHHRYTQRDVDRVTATARDTAADAIVTTAKDAVRLEGLRFGEVPVYIALSEIHGEDEVRLKSIVLRAVAGKTRK